MKNKIAIDNKACRFIDYEIGYKEYNENERSIIHYITTPDKDRGGDVINPFGMDDRDFSKAPSVFYNHNYNLPIAKSLWRKPTDDGVLAKTQFSSIDLSKDIYTLHKEDIIRTWSIGFRVPKNIQSGSQEEFSKYDKETGTLFINKWELIEYSSAPVAMNPNALDQAKNICKSLELKYELDLMEAENKMMLIINGHTKQIAEFELRISELDNAKVLSEIDKLKAELTRVYKQLENKSAEIAGKDTKISKEQIKNLFAGAISNVTGRRIKM